MSKFVVTDKMYVESTDVSVMVCTHDGEGRVESTRRFPDHFTNAIDADRFGIKVASELRSAMGIAQYDADKAADTFRSNLRND